MKREFSAVLNFLLSRHPDLSGTRALLISVPRLVWAVFSPLLLPKSLSGSFRACKDLPVYERVSQGLRDSPRDPELLRGSPWVSESQPVNEMVYHGPPGCPMVHKSLQGYQRIFQGIWGFPDVSQVLPGSLSEVQHAVLD